MPTERGETISTTQLARNLSAAIDRVRVQRRPLAITKGKRTIAQLAPAPRNGYPISELASLLANLPRLGQDAVSMARDLARARRNARIPESPWDS